MPKVLSLREIREIRRDHERDPDRTARFFRELLDGGQIRARDLSLRDLFEGLVEGGEEIVRQFDPRLGAKRGVDLREAAHAVDTSAFSNITGQIVFSTVLDRYELETDVLDDLMTTIPTRFNGERLPGIGEIGDEAEDIDEGQPYPTAGVSEEYIETPPTVKCGLIVPVTKEAVFFDRTNVLLERCRRVGTWVGVQKLKRGLATVMGLTSFQGKNWNSYKRNGVQSNTYLTSGAYVNDLTGGTANPLTDWTSINTAEQTLNNILDPNTGQPTPIKPEALLVPMALRYTAKRIFEATEVHNTYPGYASTANPAFPGNVQTVTPGKVIDTAYKVVSSRWVKFISGSNTDWWVGNFKEAFAWMENWDLEVIEAPANAEASFTMDIVQRFKASWRGAAAVRNPRYVVRCRAA